MGKLKFILLLIGVLFIAGCGGDGTGGESQNQQQNSPVAVTTTKAANGCLLSHNADAVANYLLGTRQARTLLWNCANIDSHTRVGVEAFYIFDNAQQCFTEQSVIRKGADCTRDAATPASPVLSASIRMVNPPKLVRAGGGGYALQPIDVEVTITGNLTAFGLSVEVNSHTVHFGSPRPGQPEAVAGIGDQALSGLPYLLPGIPQLHIFVPLVSQTTSPGDSYIFAVTVKDIFGNDVGSTNFSVIAPS